MQNEGYILLKGLGKVKIPESTTVINSKLIKTLVRQSDYANDFNAEVVSEKVVEICIPKNVLIIEDGSFALFEKLEKVVFCPYSQLKIIGRSAFLSCYSLKEFDFSGCPELVYIGESAFENTGLNTISLFTNSVITLEMNCFQGCENLLVVEIDKLKLIPQFCFRGCYNLLKVKINQKLIAVESDAFRGCNSLISFYSSNENLIVLSTNDELKNCI